MRKKLIAGNWKMNGDLKSVSILINKLEQLLYRYDAAQVAVFPSMIHFGYVRETLLGSQKILLGAQNVSEYDLGAYTGEVAASMLKDLGCAMVLVGHSERRSIFKESDADVAAKFVKAQEHELIPILCIGETLDEREAGGMEVVVLRQLNVVIDKAGIDAFKNAVIAYEPVWAIGTGKTATPVQAQEVHAILRERLTELSPAVAETCQILYGGSVKPSNAGELFAMSDIDGALVGGASLKANDFFEICKAVV